VRDLALGEFLVLSHFEKKNRTIQILAGNVKPYIDNARKTGKVD